MILNMCIFPKNVKFIIFVNYYTYLSISNLNFVQFSNSNRIFNFDYYNANMKSLIRNSRTIFVNKLDTSKSVRERTKIDESELNKNVW